MSALVEARARAIAKLRGALPPSSSHHPLPLEARARIPDAVPYFVGEHVDAGYRENA